MTRGQTTTQSHKDEDKMTRQRNERSIKREKRKDHDNERRDKKSRDKRRAQRRRTVFTVADENCMLVPYGCYADKLKDEQRGETQKEKGLMI